MKLPHLHLLSISLCVCMAEIWLFSLAEANGNEVNRLWYESETLSDVYRSLCVCASAHLFTSVEFSPFFPLLLQSLQLDFIIYLFSFYHTFNMNVFILLVPFVWFDVNTHTECVLLYLVLRTSCSRFICSQFAVRRRTQHTVCRNANKSRTSEVQIVGILLVVGVGVGWCWCLFFFRSIL